MKKYLLYLLLFMSQSMFAQTYQPNWKSIDSRPIPEWYKDAKFGIFIHWGVYSVPAWAPKGQYSEWYQENLQSNGFKGQAVAYHHKKYGADFSYYQFASLFKADLFDPEAWAKLFEQSGAKYIVLTSKHHDGFALWPSKEASQSRGFAWNAVEAGPKRDLLGDLFKAVRKTSVHPGIYYSLYEWYNPLWLNNKQLYVQKHMIPQIKDVIDTYKPEVFWTDGEWEQSDTLWHSTEILSWMFNDSKVKDKIVVNDRWGKDTRYKHGGFYSPEYQPNMDFKDHYFEESRGMGFSYGYNRMEDAWDYNSAKVLILHLLDKVSRGGNFLLDIGPDADGKIPPIMQERLLEIGQWLKINGQAIYGTTRYKNSIQWGPGKRDYQPKSEDNGDHIGGDIMLKLTENPDPGYAVKEVFFTQKGKIIFAIVPVWPASHKVLLRDMDLKGKKVTLLETGQVLPYTVTGKNSEVKFPEFNPGKIKTRYSYVIKID